MRKAKWSTTFVLVVIINTEVKKRATFFFITAVVFGLILEQAKWVVPINQSTIFRDLWKSGLIFPVFVTVVHGFTVSGHGLPIDTFMISRWPNLPATLAEPGFHQRMYIDGLNPVAIIMSIPHQETNTLAAVQALVSILKDIREMDKNFFVSFIATNEAPCLLERYHRSIDKRYLRQGVISTSHVKFFY